MIFFKRQIKKLFINSAQINKKMTSAWILKIIWIEEPVIEFLILELTKITLLSLH